VNEHILNKLEAQLKDMFPDINIKGSFSPPLGNYEELAKEEYIKNIIKEKPDIVWVSLGFPKQELFIDLPSKEIFYKSLILLV
jgi:N-acetylglucosaminyldiphosphoundecaprenol N-acetyl-beta-D-mannosaminyltransferase